MSLKEKLGKIGKIVSMPTIGKQSHGYERVRDYMGANDRLRVDYIDRNTEKKLDIGAVYIFDKGRDTSRVGIATGKHELYVLTDVPKN